MVHPGRPSRQDLGVPAIRLDVVPARLSKADFLKVAVAGMRKIMAQTESTGVAFGIENHGHTTNDPKFLNALFKGVGSAARADAGHGQLLLVRPSVVEGL